MIVLKMRAISRLLLCFGLATVSSWPVSAHHSDKMFDLGAVITMEGVVKEFQYTNPHAWLIVDVVNDDGTVTTWGFETGAPSSLIRADIRPVDLLPGTRITISGHPMHDGRPAAEWTTAVLEDGKMLNPGLGFQVR